MSQQRPSWGALLGLGSATAGLVIGGMALGWFLDSRFKTFPVLVVSGIALGIVLACTFAYIEFRKMMEK